MGEGFSHGIDADAAGRAVPAAEIKPSRLVAGNLSPGSAQQLNSRVTLGSKEKRNGRVRAGISPSGRVEDTPKGLKRTLNLSPVHVGSFLVLCVVCSHSVSQFREQQIVR